MHYLKKPNQCLGTTFFIRPKGTIIILQFYSLQGLFLDTFNLQRRMVLETKLTAKGMFPSTPLKINQGKLDL